MATMTNVSIAPVDGTRGTKRGRKQATQALRPLQKMLLGQGLWYFTPETIDQYRDEEYARQQETAVDAIVYFTGKCVVLKLFLFVVGIIMFQFSVTVAIVFFVLVTLGSIGEYVSDRGEARKKFQQNQLWRTSEFDGHSHRLCPEVRSIGAKLVRLCRENHLQAEVVIDWIGNDPILILRHLDTDEWYGIAMCTDADDKAPLIAYLP